MVHYSNNKNSISLYIQEKLQVLQEPAMFGHAVELNQQVLNLSCQFMFQVFILIMQTDLQFMLCIMINLYQLMSHITFQQANFGRFELGTTSKYICNYIEQRKALMLAKLARNSSPLYSNIDQTADMPKKVYTKQLDRRSFKQESKVHMRKKTSEVSCLQRSNKINKNDHNHRQNDTDKFLARTSLYQKQKYLNFQFQKKKSLYNQAQTHSFQPILLKKDQQMQSKLAQKKSQKHQQTYQQRHERKNSKNLGQQRVIYKDLIKQSMIKFDQNQQKSTAVKEEKERWRHIQQIFEKVQVFQPLYIQTIEKDQQQVSQNIYEKYLIQEQLHRLEVNQVKLSLKKKDSKQQNLNNIEQKLQIQQHFEEDLSGILIDEDFKEEVDSSHVFQQVMNDMMPQIEPKKRENNFQNQVVEAEIVPTISILQQSLSQKAQNEANSDSNHQFKQIPEQQWIKNEEKENKSQQLIVIKKVESQIIDNRDVQSNKDQFEQVLYQPKVQKLQQNLSIQIEIEKNAENQSLIDKLSQQIIGDVPLTQITMARQQQNSQRQRQSLQIMANQFIYFKNDKKPSEDDQDLDIPDEQAAKVALQCFNFNQIGHEFTENILTRAIHLAEPIAPVETQNLVCLNELNQHQNEQAVQQIQQAEQYQFQEPKFKTPISSLRNFGQFLIIPQESEQESHQSVS